MAYAEPKGNQDEKSFLAARLKINKYTSLKKNLNFYREKLY